MRVVIQRVTQASVEVEGKVVGQINQGLLVLLGIEDADDHSDINWLANKIVNLRIFDDQDKVMNKSLLDNQGEVLLVSQFTLHAMTKKGNRPSYIRAAKPEFANKLYQEFASELHRLTNKIPQMGVFGADMAVSLLNDGPVTIIIDTKDKQ